MLFLTNILIRRLKNLIFFVDFVLTSNSLHFQKEFKFQSIYYESCNGRNRLSMDEKKRVSKKISY